VAFDFALYSLCVDLLELGYRSRPLELRAVETRPQSSLNDLAGTPADRLLEAHKNALDVNWLTLPPAEGFAALAALPLEAKQRLFAWCIAACLKPQLAVENQADPVLESAGRRLAIPFADYWRPTAANYWGRVKKAHGVAIAGAVRDNDAAGIKAAARLHERGMAAGIDVRDLVPLHADFNLDLRRLGPAAMLEHLAAQLDPPDPVCVRSGDRDRNPRR
jgi:ParB family chromosome partitioning protein